MSHSLDATLDEFKRHLSDERRLSAHTVLNYLRDLNKLRQFCEQRNLDDWAKINANHIRQYSAWLHHQGLSSRTIQRMLSSARALFNYLNREGLMSINPAKAVSAPKGQKRLPKTLDVDQMSALLDHLDSYSFVGCRDKAMMELLYSSGLRLAELASLNIRDVDFGDQLVYVTGKGDKSRVLPIGRQAMKALQLWLEMRDKQGFFDEKALFITQQGRRLGDRAIQKRLSHWGKKLGISDHVHPHRLRHAFASHMLEASGDLRAVQELLGHADISTTQIYTHVDFQQLAKVYDSAHPRAKKRSGS
jgi:integrase/recombinase XerC